VDEAADVAGWLTPDVISDDERLDVMSGAAARCSGCSRSTRPGRQATILQAASTAASTCSGIAPRRALPYLANRRERPLTGFSRTVPPASPTRWLASTT